MEIDDINRQVLRQLYTRKIAPNPKTNPTQGSIFPRGNFLVAPNPKTNLNLDQNPNPNRERGGRCSFLWGAIVQIQNGQDNLNIVHIVY